MQAEDVRSDEALRELVLRAFENITGLSNRIDGEYLEKLFNIFHLMYPVLDEAKKNPPANASQRMRDLLRTIVYENEESTDVAHKDGAEDKEEDDMDDNGNFEDNNEDDDDDGNDGEDGEDGEDEEEGEDGKDGEDNDNDSDDSDDDDEDEEEDGKGDGDKRKTNR